MSLGSPIRVCCGAIEGVGRRRLGLLLLAALASLVPHSPAGARGRKSRSGGDQPAYNYRSRGGGGGTGGGTWECTVPHPCRDAQGRRFIGATRDASNPTYLPAPRR